MGWCQPYSRKKPSGRETDWPACASQWPQYADMRGQASPGYGDPVYLYHLQPLLDDLSATQLTSLLEQKPGLVFEDFWLTLEQQFACDRTGNYPETSACILLEHPSYPSLQEYRAHFVHWEAALRRITGLSVKEATQKFWLSSWKLFSEQSRRRSSG